jgi:hypothetical protein
MQNLELAYLAVAYGMTAVMFYTSRHNTFRTVSHIALSRRLNRYVFFWGLLLSAVLFAVLMYGWAIPHFRLNSTAKVIVGLLVASQILTGYFPVDSGKFKKAHLTFGLVLGLCMFALVGSFAAASTVSHDARVLDGMLAIAMIATLIHGKFSPKRTLVKHEQIFFGIWHLAILLTVYAG